MSGDLCMFWWCIYKVDLAKLSMLWLQAPLSIHKDYPIAPQVFIWSEIWEQIWMCPDQGYLNTNFDFLVSDLLISGQEVIWSPNRAYMTSTIDDDLAYLSFLSYLWSYLPHWNAAMHTMKYTRCTLQYRCMNTIEPYYRPPILWAFFIAPWTAGDVTIMSPKIQASIVYAHFMSSWNAERHDIAP